MWDRFSLSWLPDRLKSVPRFIVSGRRRFGAMNDV